MQGAGRFRYPQPPERQLQLRHPRRDREPLAPCGHRCVPFSPYLTTDNENIGIASFGSPRYTEFPNLVCDPVQGFHPTASAWFNTGCYQLPAFGTRGGAGRHAVYSQGLRNWDAAVNKQWPLGENKSRSLQFRGEFFNALNATTFDPPGVFFGAAGFGKVSSTVRQPGRQIQLALKVHF